MSSNQRSENGWIPLLQWDPPRAAKLPDLVERIQLEPHPVSGEIEIDDVRPAKYRRLDEETLHSRLEVEQFELLPIFVWCEDDEHGQTGAGWKLAELRSIEDMDDGSQWYESVSEANNAAHEAANTHTIAVPQHNGPSYGQTDFSIPADDEEEDDGSYWAAYDRTPGRTPAQKRSPAPPAASSGRPRTQSELEYFNQYGSVQPAMDGHDPDEEMPDMGESSLSGNALGFGQHTQQQQHEPSPPYLQVDKPREQHDSAVATALTQSLHGEELSMPRPISPTSSHGSIDRLEEQAAAMSSVSRDADRAQLGIKQHISTDIKSLFRLAKSAGMERAEFEEYVRRELEVLSLLEHDE